MGPWHSYTWRNGHNDIIYTTNVRVSFGQGDNFIQFNSNYANPNYFFYGYIVFYPPDPPSITTQPISQTAAIGTTVTFSVSASGYPPSYQWLKNGTNLPGATASSFTLSVQAEDYGQYNVVLTNSYGVVTSQVATLTVIPGVTTQPQSQTVGVGSTVTLSVQPQSSLLSYQWRKDGGTLVGATNSILILTNVQMQASGDYAVVLTNVWGAVTSQVATLTVQQIVGWGGDSTICGRMSTNPPAGLANVVAIAAGDCASYALRSDGTVVPFGPDELGSTHVPADLTNAVAISAGTYYCVALRSDGTLIGWGYSDVGQTSVPSGSFVAIAFQCRHGLAIKENGTVAAWGENYDGESNVPAGLSNVVAVAAGEYHSLALRADGTVVGWGSNYGGQTNVPVGLTNVVAIAAGRIYGLALKADGSLVAWGAKTYGNLMVPGGPFVAISGNELHSLALRADGTVVAWGDNYAGQTVVPAGLSNVKAIAAGTLCSLVLVGSGPLVVNGLPTNPALISNVFGVSLISQCGRVYRLEYKDNLSDSIWTTLPLVAGTGSTLTFRDPAATVKQRFYRVRRW